MRYEDALPRATPPLGAVSGKAQDVLAAHDGSENEAARELLDDALGTARMRAASRTCCRLSTRSPMGSVTVITIPTCR